MKRLFTFTCFFLTLFVGFSQTHLINGKVTDDDIPLMGVDISVKGTDYGTTTNIDGYYEFEVPEGIQTLIFSYGGQKEIPVNVNQNRTINADMTDVKTTLDQVFISSVRVDADSPITYSNLGEEEINKRNLGQDIPILMNYMPNVVSTSDAGAGIGYTGMRVRGNDASRTNVTINGIPLNDAESQASIWVDLGDFTNSIKDLQLQRGVGTSTNGAGAFGASLNVLTSDIQEKASAEITNTYGSFNSHKHQLKFDTGLIDKHFAFTGNFSVSKSDGYRDRAFSDLKSYFLQGVYKNKNTLIKALSFGGSEKTYQAYYGLSAEELKENRKFNPSGMYTDSDGNIQFYKNQTDNYKQDHFQLMWNQKYNSDWSSNLAFHYTYGRGYYESYHQDADLNAFGLPYFDLDGQTQTTSDLVNQKWLDNHFYGAIFNVNYETGKIKTILGGGINQYDGDHYGDVVYAKFAQLETPFEHYYDNNGIKNDFNIYSKTSFAITNNLQGFVDLQWRNIFYKTEGPYEGEYFNMRDNFNFFNPKAGLTYQINEPNQLYFSFARAHKEPNRADYKGAILGQTDPEYPKAEAVNDYELGWRYHTEKAQINSNIYYMDYRDQLVLTGEMDAEGRFMRKNSGKSYRLGLEIDANIKITHQLQIRPNISLSQNKNKDFKTEINGTVETYGDTDISFSPQIIGGNIISYQPIKNLNIDFLTKFVGEQYLSNIEAGDSKLDSYLVNSLNIQYKWQKAPWFKEIVFSGLVNNIFDEKYISNGYYTPGYGVAYFPQAGINFLTGITLKF